MKREKAPAPKKDFGVEDYLHQHKRTIDNYLDTLLPSVKEPPSVLHESMRYSVFAGGKRIRPILALATGEALQTDSQKLIDLACALEMIHTYSLIHDDLPAMDDDDYRRGKPTSHKQFGEGIAILAGDALLTLAFQCLAEIPTKSKIRVQVILNISQAAGSRGGMLAGQVLDLTTQGQTFSAEHLEQIHSFKTGALIRASVLCSALVSGASEADQKRLGAFGSNVGLAFQIVDDILDVEGSSQELGKTSGKDDLNNKATYPDMYGLETSRKFASTLIDQATEELSFLGTRGEILNKLARFISVRRF